MSKVKYMKSICDIIKGFSFTVDDIKFNYDIAKMTRGDNSIGFWLEEYRNDKLFCKRNVLYFFSHNNKGYFSVTHKLTKRSRVWKFMEENDTLLELCKRLFLCVTETFYCDE